MPEMPLDRVVKHLVVTDRRLQERIPVHQTLAAIDASLTEQVKKGVPHGAGTDFVQREPRSAPITTAAHPLQLT